MSKRGPEVIHQLNISIAWAKALLLLAERSITSIEPLIINVGGLGNCQPVEDTMIRTNLDSFLEKYNEQSSATVANTIFPRNLWNRLEDRELLYKRYMHILPRLKKSSPKNKYGLYFERLIAFTPASYTKPINQLEHIISTYAQGNHRSSALQASIFDPTRDHTNARQRGFPCLQQISLNVTDGKYLHLTALYATQYYIERAYGNLLGLCHLGWFLADAMKLTFDQLTCVAAKASIGKRNRTESKPLITFLTNYLSGQPTIESSVVDVAIRDAA